ncbi:MAG: hypothetical protein QOC97_1542 [Chloroflexota bacterium]|nr:hypothetical protein [Chloroflexota bacterium]
MIHLPVRFRTSRARSAIAGLLALSLSASAGMVVASSTAVPSAGLGTTIAATSASTVTAASGVASRTSSSGALPPGSDLTTTFTQAAPEPSIALSARLQVAAQAKTEVAASKPKAAPKPTAVAPRKVTVSFRGVYHLWIPALSLSRDIDDWGCNGGLIPNHVEYWGCAGRNNLYLLGHAWGVFAKIHDGYHSGALRAGLTAWYADKAGRVHRYRISWVRHVRNADYASWSQWAMASTSGPVITLQTCDGATSAYRILVRLVPA